MKNIIYTPFIKSNKNDFPEITPRGYKRHYTSNDVNNSEEVTIVTEDPEKEEIDFSLPDINLKFTDKESFKNRMLLEYRSALAARGINPEFAKYLVAQDALETGWGSKPVGLYNYGNITGRSGKTLEVPEFLNGKWENQKQTFKNYNSIREFVNDKIDLLSKKRYDVFSHPVTEFVSRVTSGGYATSPNYEQSLNNVIRNMKRGGVLKFQEGGAKIRKFDKGTFKATFDWVSNMNGKVKDAKKKGLSYPEFWVNLRDSNRPWSIDEHGNAYTHKMAWGEYDGNYIVYPEAQVENGILVDYSKYRDLAIERALANGEYVIAPSAEIAEEFTREYKNLPWFKDFDYDTEESRVPYRRAGSYQKAIKYGVWDSPFTGNLEVPRQVISEEWVPDESFVPTIEDLAKQLTMPYEDFRDKPYLLETKRADGSTQKQWLIGYGIADKGIINKYKNSGIPKDIAQQWVIDELTGLHKSLGISEPNYHKLPWNLQLAILDAAYNTNGASFWSVSKNLAKLVRNGETDLSKLISELDHSKTVRGWLGDRSAARRALANGQYRWNWKYVDEKGRHYNPNIPLGSEDWKRALYIDNF